MKIAEIAFKVKPGSQMYKKLFYSGRGGDQILGLGFSFHRQVFWQRMRPLFQNSAAAFRINVVRGTRKVQIAASEKG